MERIYYLNGEESSLDCIIEYLEDLLVNNGNTDLWADFGIDFEDKEI